MSMEATAPRPRKDRRLWVLAIVLLAIGAWLRLSAATRFQPSGTEELLYGAYVKFLSTSGLASYPDLVERCVAAQEQNRLVMPPMRVTQMVPATVLHWLTQWDEKVCLNTVAALFSFLMLPLGLLFARRLAGMEMAVATLGLMVCAATQLFAAGRAGVDGIVAFWSLAALWALWECLQRPDDRRPQVALAVTVALLVLTKENCIHILAAFGCLLLVNRWLKFGTLSRGTLLAFTIGLGAGYALLLAIGGGLQVLPLLSAEPGPYALATGDGPWHRYLFDLMVVSPLVLIFAITALARLDGAQRSQLFFAVFLAVSFVAMATEPYGANLRFSSYWDFPLRFLAATTAFQIFGAISWRPLVATAAAVVVLGLSDLHQYNRIFVSRGVDDPITPELLRAEDIVKSSPRR